MDTPDAGDSSTMRVPIFRVLDRYLLFDVEAIAYFRDAHRICGVLTGTIPQAAQQNIFSGVPLELMPEEVRLLAMSGHAYVVDDVEAHVRLIQDMDIQRKKEARSQLREQGLQRARMVHDASVERRTKALAKQANKQRKSQRQEGSADVDREDTGSQLTSSPPTSLPQCTEKELEPLVLIPTTSYPSMYPLEDSSSSALIPQSTPSYYVFAHMHARGYFLSPGLRFGCQYMAYPGDPLRFHSHFLVTGKQWDEPINLLDIVSGGRLGTGVKKGYLLGGTPNDADEEQPSTDAVRTFCFEWAAM